MKTCRVGAWCQCPTVGVLHCQAVRLERSKNETAKTREAVAQFEAVRMGDAHRHMLGVPGAGRLRVAILASGHYGGPTEGENAKAGGGARRGQAAPP